MKWIAFVQIIYRTLAVYQEKKNKTFNEKSTGINNDNGSMKRPAVWRKLAFQSSYSQWSFRKAGSWWSNKGTAKKEKKKKRTPPFLFSLLALEAVIVVMVIKLQTSMKVYIAVIAI